MAKKRFTDGLSDLFDNPFDGSAPTPSADGDAVGDDEVSFDVNVPVKNKATRKKLSGKGFAGSLDNFLNDSFEQAGSSAPQPRRRRRTGLDFLIRSTVEKDDEDRNPVGPKPKDTKRVTLIFRKDHLVELKDLAKERGMYLKDLVADMAAKYLEE